MRVCLLVCVCLSMYVYVRLLILYFLLIIRQVEQSLTSILEIESTDSANEIMISEMYFRDNREVIAVVA